LTMEVRDDALFVHLLDAISSLVPLRRRTTLLLRSQAAVVLACHNLAICNVCL
jgi:hypothetical protein